jgi:hypothetical protein
MRILLIRILNTALWLV